MEETKKNDKKGCTILMTVIIFLVGFALFMFGRYWKNIGNYMKETDEMLQNRLDALPVLTTDDEINAAIKGEPKDYVVKNYKFTASPTVRDTVFNFLNGDYLCVHVVEETLTYYRKATVTAGETPYFSIWEEKPYCQIVAPLCLNNGVEISQPDSLRFLFSLWDRSKRIFENEVNPDMVDHLSIDSRYYPDLSVNFNDFEKTVQDIFKNFGDNAEELAKHFGENGIKFDTRYNFTYMSKDDVATFAVRLGGGKADFNVFPGENIVIVGGDHIQTSDIGDVAGTAWSVMGTVFMVFAAIVMLGAVIGIIITIKG